MSHPDDEARDLTDHLADIGLAEEIQQVAYWNEATAAKLLDGFTALIRDRDMARANWQAAELSDLRSEHEKTKKDLERWVLAHEGLADRIDESNAEALSVAQAQPQPRVPRTIFLVTSVNDRDSQDCPAVLCWARTRERAQDIVGGLCPDSHR